MIDGGACDVGDQEIARFIYEVHLYIRKTAAVIDERCAEITRRK